MDIRILVFFLCVSITASFAHLRSPHFRSRRNGLQESYKPRVMEFNAVSRTKRESSSPNTTEKTTTSASTSNPSSSIPFDIGIESTTMKEPDPKKEPTTSSTSESTTTTSDMSKPSSTTESSSTSVPTTEQKLTTSKTEPTTSEADSATPSPSTKSITTETDSTTPSPTTKPTMPPTDSTNPSSTTKPTMPQTDSTSSSPTTKPTMPPTDSTNSSPTTKPTMSQTDSTSPSPTTKPTMPQTDSTSPNPTTKPKTPQADTTISSPNTKPTTPKTDSTTPSTSTKPTMPKADTTPSSSTAKPTPSKPKPSKSNPTNTPVSTKPAETTTTTKKPKDSGKSTDPTSTTASPAIGLRFGAPEDDDGNVKEKPKLESGMNQAPNQENPMNSGFTLFPFTPFFMPPFVPNYAPYYPSPSFDPTVNTIPSAGNNYAWTGPTNGAGVATSFASASATAGASDNSNHNEPPFDYYGGYPNDPNIGIPAATALEPNTVNMPNAINAGGYGTYEGDTPFYDPSAFAFPGYNLEAFQRQMEDNFRQLQAQFQKQQQSIFEATNRIASDGAAAPGAHTAYSSINLGPRGGYQAGAINPAAPGIESRFGEEVPPPSGNSFGVFSSSSSHTAVDPSGKTISHKSSTTGVNDNGKITFRTVQD